MNNNLCSILICVLLCKTISSEMTSGLKVVDVDNDAQNPSLTRQDEVLFRCKNPDNTSIDTVTIHGDGLESTDALVAEIRVKLSSEHIFVTAFCFFHYKNDTVSPHHIRHYPIILPPTFPSHGVKTTFEVLLGQKSEVIVTFISNPPIHHSHIHIRTPDGHNFTLFRLSHQRGGIHHIHMRFVDVFRADLGRYVITLKSPYGVARNPIFLVDHTTPTSLHFRNKIIGIICGIMLSIIVGIVIGFGVRKCRTNNEFRETLLNDEAYVAGSAGRDDVFLTVQEDRSTRQGPSGSLPDGANMTTTNDKEIIFVQKHDYSEMRDTEMQEIKSPVS